MSKEQEPESNSLFTILICVVIAIVAYLVGYDNGAIDNYKGVVEVTKFKSKSGNSSYIVQSKERFE